MIDGLIWVVIDCGVSCFDGEVWMLDVLFE